MSDNQKLPDVICCGKVAKKAIVDGTYLITCKVCGTSVSEDTPESAFNAFQLILAERADAAPAHEEVEDAVVVREEPVDVSMPTTERISRDTLPAYFAKNLSAISDFTLPFIARDKPALTRLIRNNLRYVMSRNDEAFGKCWSSPDGQQSIVVAVEEALSLGAELGKMGSLVPFNGICEFIPAVEAYEFALTNGNNPPFRWIQIESIHKNDIHEIARINGQFSISIKPAVPRGPLQAVAAYGYSTRLDMVIGEVYDVDRLLEKAKRHSSSYQYYLGDKAAFEQARTEGKIKRDAKGEYTERQMNSRNGAWTKKVYREDITNPYEGPDQPEMLRKAAGKSFLGKFARVRNAESAQAEVSGSRNAESIATASIDAAFESVGL